MPTAKPAHGRKIELTSIITAGLYVLLFAYLALRAATLSLTHDEAMILQRDVSRDWLDLVMVHAENWPIDIHVLHTLAVKASTLALGLSEPAVRLPALFGSLLFLTGLGMSLQRLFSGWGHIVGVLAIGFNPALVDHLGLADGTGLGLGLTMLGVGTLLAAVCRKPGTVRPWPARAAFFLFALAATADAFLIPILVAASLVLLIATSVPLAGRFTFVGWLGSMARAIGIVLPAAPVLAWLSLAAWAVYRHGQFEVTGGGFWSDTAGSLIAGTLHGAYPMGNADWLPFVWILATIVLAPAAAWALWREDRQHYAAFSALLGMTVLAALTIVALRYAITLPYPVGRRALFLLPLLTLSALSLTALVRTAQRWLEIAGTLIGIVVPLWLGIHGLLSMNRLYVLDARSDAATHDVMLTVKEWLLQRRLDEPVQMRVTPSLEPVASYYRSVLGIDQLAPLVTDAEKEADLYFLSEADEATMAKTGVRELARSPLSGTVLFERLR